MVAIINSFRPLGWKFCKNEFEIPEKFNIEDFDLLEEDLPGWVYNDPGFLIQGTHSADTLLKAYFSQVHEMSLADIDAYLEHSDGITFFFGDCADTLNIDFCQKSWGPRFTWSFLSEGLSIDNGEPLVVSNPYNFYCFTKEKKVESEILEMCGFYDDDVWDLTWGDPGDWEL